MSATAALPRRMTISHGGRALLVAAVAEVTGTTASPDHAIAIALISVVGGFLVMIVQLTVSDWLRNRRRPPLHPDQADEQAELNQRLIDQLLDRDEEIARLRRQLGRK